MGSPRASPGGARRLALKEVTREELHESKTAAQRELPKAVQRLARNDTVCRFCGVSYLIFNEFKAIEKQLETARRDLAEATQRNNVDERIEQAVRARSEAWAREKATLQAALEDQTKHHANEAKAAADRASRRQLALQQQLARLARALGTLRGANESLRSATKRKLKTQRDAFISLMQAVADRARALEDRLDSGRSEALRHEQAAVEARAEALAASELQRAHASKTESLQQKLAALEESLKTTASAQRAETGAALAECAALKESHIAELERASRAHAGAMEALRKDQARKVDALQSEWARTRSELDESASTWQQRHEALEQERRELEARMRVIQEQSGAARASNQDLQEAVGELEARVAEACRSRDSLKKALDHALQSRELASTKEAKLEAELRLTVEHHEREMVRLRAEAEQVKQHAETDLKSQLATIKRDLDALQAQASAAAEEHEATMRQSRQEAAQDQQKIVSLEAELRRSRQDAAQCQQRASCLEAELAARDGRIEKECATQASLKQDHEAACAALATLRAEQDVAKTALAGAQVEAAEARRAAAAMQVRSEDLEQRVLALQGAQGQCEELKKQMAALQPEIVTLRGRDFASLRRCEALAQEVAEARARSEALERQLKAAEFSEPGAGLEALEQHMIRLSSLVREKDAEIKVLQATVHRQCLERTSLLAQQPQQLQR